MSHGQATMKHGFSINNDILESNMSPETVISKRIICDHVRSNQLKPHIVDVNNGIILAFTSASIKYKINSKDNQKQKEEIEKVFHLTADINRIKMKCMKLEKAGKMMHGNIIECMKFVEKKQCLNYAIKGNRLKRDTNKTKESIGLLEKEILELEKKNRKLK